MIKSIELHNWKTHLDSRFEFSRGTNVLVGQIGSGKSATMDAVCFALFGTFPALQQRRIALHEIIMARPNRMEQCDVKLCFQYNGREFAVERKIKARGSSEARLFIDGKFTAGPKPQDVNAAIERNIEISYNLFSRAVYSEQNQIDYFLRLSPSQRKEKFDELLELDRYETARSSAVSALNRLKAIVQDREKWLQEQEKEALAENLAEMEKAMGRKERRLAGLKDAEGKKSRELGQLKDSLKQLGEKEKRFTELNEEVSKKLVLVETLESEAREGKEKLKGLGAEEIRKRIAGEEARAKELEEEAGELEKKEKDLIEKAGAMRQEIKGNEAKAREIEQQTGQVESAAAKCPVCKAALDGKKKKGIIEENRKSVGLLLEKNKELHRKIAELGENERKVREGIGERKRKMKKIEAAVKELGKLLELSERAEEKKTRVKKLRKEAAEAKKKIDELGFDERKARDAREALIRAEGELGANKKEQSGIQEILGGARREMERAKKRQERVVELKKLVKAMEANSEKLQLFTNSLKETQAQLRESLIETINEAMDSLWQKIYPYGDYASAKMGVENGNYELMVRDRSGKWVRVEGILSGGERSAAAICIRIAFSLVLTRNISWIILDEPTHNLDTATVSHLSRMMRENLPGLIEQVFVITHDKEMEKAASGKLYLLKRNKETGEPTRLEEIALES